MADIVVGRWTFLGGEGFQYYWNPEDLQILWRHPVTGHQAMCKVDPDYSDEELEYTLMQRTWDLEASYRHLVLGED